MQHLSDLNGETITLSTLIGTQFIPLKIIESRHLLLAHEAAEDIKDGKPILPFGATQKVLLSQLDDKNLKPLLKIAKDTHRRSFDSEAFARELAQIGEQGFAFSSGERIPGALCLSCPVHNYPYPLALSIIAPETRIGAKISRFSKIIKQSANRISRNILESNK
jgi:DNA-binding IclR family transcriptional regulator